MTTYHFLADLLDTFQSSADWIKALMVTMPWVFLLGTLGLTLYFWSKTKQASEPATSPPTVTSRPPGR